MKEKEKESGKGSSFWNDAIRGGRGDESRNADSNLGRRELQQELQGINALDDEKTVMEDDDSVDPINKPKQEEESEAEEDPEEDPEESEEMEDPEEYEQMDDLGHDSSNEAIFLHF
ncbi:hypothetical protein OIU77_012292 [Salix suchowensis]|uniref:Uncharacterized protein n=1 Tax=Salix suchowensis TaxID=1278906 RepID=A0ABQ9A365_9ROSI|nr:hypothetical protein OIU77_012292 [Salix suchowensis]